MVKLYGFSKVNPIARGHTRDLRVLWALEEMQLPCEIVGLDHPAHDLDTEAFRAVSPFAQIPVIDDDGLVLTESGAIVLHLARKSGRLLPADREGEAQVLRWCFAALNTVELPLMALVVHDWTAGPGASPHRDFLVGWAQRVFGNLERWMQGREFVATGGFSVADILLAHVLKSCIKDEALLAPYPTLVAYRDRCLARPAWQRTVKAYEARVQAG
ncbi:MAG: glutathione S-transferase family protein [Comamonadaceae bacterium]|nr:MAG: glutathione S-transferase family protein [Comamonadaceae bacterium]